MLIVSSIIFITACVEDEVATNEKVVIEPFENDLNLPARQQVSQSNNSFCIDLFKRIDKENENIVFSSFSVSNAMLMAGEMMNEGAAKAIRTGLKLPENITTVREGYQSILKAYGTENKDYKLSIANAVWIEKKESIVPEHQANIEKFYLGKALSFDNSQPKITADLVNKWCDNNTNGMIKQILSPGDINSNTLFILTNVIYFKGMWREKFEESRTSEMLFYNSQGKEATAKFMQTNEKFAYTENEAVQVLKMRYKGNFSMLIILPRENEINSVKNSLTSEMLTKWNENLTTYDVEVSLPKFKFEFATNLNAPLTQLGMGEAFGSGGLAIDQVMHKAIIDVNEEGTEAAAVTAVTMTRSMPQEYEKREFKADHPFIFVIQEEMTNNILFMGKVEKPEYK